MTGSLFCDDGLLNNTTILKSLGLEKPKPSPAAVIEPIMSVAVGVAPDTTHFTLVHMILAFYIIYVIGIIIVERRAFKHAIVSIRAGAGFQAGIYYRTKSGKQFKYALIKKAPAYDKA
ncbi:uncharacterized protein BKA78DRAFT_299161 [Phyllosticta capitalensis]|uniref:uncharacterized protein n=1 Tax=Phyllosticta capitalensis TaxID=121624 RepID=UPI00312D2972